ncbi:MAG: GWxTD domain-containing protein [Candidatus Zixiibacteriota bacterium]|nr:MAG: GWxTD domain-containing protein [candidate division Zixibacteria bacterium]
MMTYKTHIVAILIALTMVAGVVHGQSAFNVFSKDANDPYFLVDHAVFNSTTPGKVRLEVYYQIYNAALEFYRQGGVYAAEYEILVAVYGKNDLLVDSYRDTKRIKVRTEAQAKSRFDYRTNLVKFDLDPEKYEVKLTLTDARSDKSIERSFKTKAQYLQQKHASLSDIQLVQSASATGDDATKFDKGEFTVVPSVSHKYGSDDALKLMFYFEVYQGQDSASEVQIETSLRHDTRGMLYRDSLSSEFVDGAARQLREISLEDLRPGGFRLHIALKGRRDKKVDEKDKYFELVWSEKSLLKHDYESILSQLSIIAQDSDVDQLKGLETFDERQRAFAEFWLGRDPTPGTPDNEVKTEFYRRINFANQHFSYLRRAGWKTDRGRVYIVYGEPDQVDDYPFVLDRQPYQEWHYYREARYRKFVFVDENGDGDFRLVYPYDGLGHRPEF